MRRDYLDSMKADGFGDFFAACEELKTCKFIVAEIKMVALLKAIADNKKLYSMFGAALYGFDYKATFTSCVNNNSFSLPSDPQKAIALVFRILTDIDSGKMPLQKFLEAYFYSESFNESYARFGLEVIAPFESYCRMFIAQSDEEPDIKMSKQYDGVNDKFIGDLKADALRCVSLLIDYGNNVITGMVERAEYSKCLKGLVNAIKSFGPDEIVSSFLGVKYAVSYFFKSDPDVGELYKKLEYDIKHLAN